MWILLKNNVVPLHFSFLWNYTDLQYNRFIIALIGVLGGCFIKLAVDRTSAGKKIEQMEKERSQAELTYLKAQINPHFLFNSLNSLYAQLELDTGGAKNTLSSLSQLMRYQLYECNADVIAIDKETAYISSYFNLQRIRKDNCKTEIIIGEVPAGLYIAPLLLIPFLENAFKYVSDSDNEPNFIKTKISINGNILEFYCANTFTVKTELPENPHVGIGLINVKKRLALIYGKDYNLEMGVKNNIYVANLMINLPNA
jgi:sensor histidine kinase YesM